MRMKYFGWRATVAALAMAGALSCVGCADGSCEDENAGRTFEDGDHWTCSDGCNGCVCHDGTVTSTLIGCEEPPGEAAGKLSCQGERGIWFAHGLTFSCGDGCCICDDGKAVESPESC